MVRKKRNKIKEPIFVIPTEEQKRRMEEWIAEVEMEIKKTKKKRERKFVSVTEEEKKDAAEMIAEWDRKIREEGGVEVEWDSGKYGFPIGIE